jgi:hypothetical protein
MSQYKQLIDSKEYDSPSALQLAKKILLENINILHGVFGVIEVSGYFPPKEFLNEFFMIGYDPCDQDRRIGRWIPFLISSEDYFAVKESWYNRKFTGCRLLE